MSTSNPAPGWYPNPERAGTLRYWNGELWTEHVHEEQPAQAPFAAAPLGGPPPLAGGYGSPSTATSETPGFIGAFKDAVTGNYANFSGRLSVGGYWRFVAMNIAITIGLFILLFVADIFVIPYLLYVLAMVVPGLAAGVRRLHDTGKSGWAILISLIPLVGTVILIVWLASGGNPSHNAYGPPPN